MKLPQSSTASLLGGATGKVSPKVGGARAEGGVKGSGDRKAPSFHTELELALATPPSPQALAQGVAQGLGLGTRGTPPQASSTDVSRRPASPTQPTERPGSLAGRDGPEAAGRAQASTDSRKRPLAQPPPHAPATEVRSPSPRPAPGEGRAPPAARRAGTPSQIVTNVATPQPQGSQRLQVPLLSQRAALPTLPTRAAQPAGAAAGAAHSLFRHPVNGAVAREPGKEAEQPRREERAVKVPERAATPGVQTPTALDLDAAPSLPTLDPSLPAAAAPLLEAAREDPTLRATVLPNVAHVRCQIDGAGELGLHLRIRDGVAEVRLDGQAAQSVGRRSELEAALATEGLRLGNFDLPQERERQQHRADPAEDDVPFRPTPRPNRRTEAAAAPSASRLHVKA